MKGYKTFLFNALSFVVYALAYEPLKQWVDPQTLGAVIAVINIVLRILTSTPIFRRF